MAVAAIGGQQNKGLRRQRICWKVFMKVLTHELAQWPHKGANHRFKGASLARGDCDRTHNVLGRPRQVQMAH